MDTQQETTDMQQETTMATFVERARAGYAWLATGEGKARGYDVNRVNWARLDGEFMNHPDRCVLAQASGVNYADAMCSIAPDVDWEWATDHGFSGAWGAWGKQADAWRQVAAEHGHTVD